MGNAVHNPWDEGIRDGCMLWHTDVPYEHVIRHAENVVSVIATREDMEITVETVWRYGRQGAAMLSLHAGIS